MAFTDALIDHADVRVALVDRRAAAGGHWLNAYPFVRLHQSSTFYGVASTLLGGGRIQQEGPRRGSTSGPTSRRSPPTTATCWRTGWWPPAGSSSSVGCDYVGGRTFVSLGSGERFEVSERCRIVDARYLAPDIPAELPPRFGVADGVRVIPVNDLVRTEESPSQYVVVGSGKTATDACIWLLARGVDPDAICWVRPREPWMLNRALIQPDPVIYLGMVADMLRAAANGILPGCPVPRARGRRHRCCASTARSTPTMAKAPTLGRLGAGAAADHRERRTPRPHRHGAPGPDRPRARDRSPSRTTPWSSTARPTACKMPPLVPIWRPEAITVQPVRAGFPCFGAALAGYVEATRDDDGVKNALCPPSSYGNTLTDWARMNVLGLRNSRAFGAEPDIRDWSHRVALNPARIPPEHPGPRSSTTCSPACRSTPGPGSTASPAGRPPVRAAAE